MNLGTITGPQAKLIREVCDWELKSLDRILSGEVDSEEAEQLLEQFGIQPEELYDTFIAMRKKFIAIKADPERIRTLDKIEVSLFKHILYTVQPHYKDKSPNALSNLWDKLEYLGNFSVSPINYN